MFTAPDCIPSVVLKMCSPELFTAPDCIPSVVLKMCSPELSTAPDCIPSVVLKMCSPELSTALIKLLNKCLFQSFFHLVENFPLFSSSILWVLAVKLELIL